MILSPLVDGISNFLGETCLHGFKYLGPNNGVLTRVVWVSQNFVQFVSMYSHCAFSSNLFQRHIVQKHINQMSPPGNKKCSPGNVFGIKPPSNPWTFEQERP